MPLNVALVESEPALQSLIHSTLGPRGYSVEAYDSASTAWERLSGSRPHLLILEAELNDGSGLDLLRRLRDRHGKASYPALIASGKQSEEDILAGYAAGADEYLTKPFSREELLAKCAILIARSAHGSATHVEDTAPERILFGRYEVQGILGRGAFGVVYQAADLHHQRRIVALKVCDEEQAADPAQRVRFLRESYALASLNHAHIVDVDDFGMLEKNLYLAMSYVPGPTLERRVETQGKLSLPEALALTQGLAGALQALHAASLVHRDVKPANIILRRGVPQDPVLVDFGLAKRSFERSVTAATTVVGTPGYMAPEVFLGEEADHRSDLFALGLVLHFALTGEQVFPHLRGVALLMRIARGAISLPPLEHPGLRSVLAGLLEPERDRRLDSAQAALELLSAEDSA